MRHLRIGHHPAKSAVTFREMRKQKFGGVSFKQTSRGLAYVGETKRTATSDEVKRMKSAHPKETQIEFDVVVTINAKFDSNRLADYRISKMESF